MKEENLFKQQDSANYIMYQKIRVQSRSEKNTVNEADTYKQSLAREYFQLANSYYKKKQYQMSVNLYQSALKNNYQSHQIHNNLGVMYALLKQMDEAIKCFNKSIQIKTTQIFARINLANIYIKNGSFAKGFELYLNLLGPQQKGQILDPNQERRIFDHFNKVIKHYNNFYKFFIKQLRACHKKIDPDMLQQIFKTILKDVDKSAPITDIFQSPQNVITQSHIQQLKSKYSEIIATYSRLHWSKNRSNFSLSISYAQQFANCFSSIKNKDITALLGLLFTYIFIEKMENDLTCHFYSRINKFQTKNIRDGYLKIYQNFQKYKKSQCQSYFKQFKTVKQKNNSDNIKKSVIISIDRFFFHQNIPMYHLYDLKFRQSKFNVYDWQSIQPLANSLKKLQNYKCATAFYFNQYQIDKNKPQFIQDYFLDASLQGLYYHNHNQKNFNYENSLTQIQRQFDQGYCTISQQIKIAQYQSYIYFKLKKYDQAIIICEQAINNFKNKDHKFFQFLGTIFQEKGTSNFSEAEKYFKKAINYSSKNQQAHFQLYCLLYWKCQQKINRQIAEKKLSIEKDTKNVQKQIQIFDEFCNQTIPKIYHQEKKQILSYLIQAIKIKPSQLKFYLQLELFYSQQTILQQQISKLINFLHQQYTRSIDFKVQSNIAIFNLMIGKYNQSYQYLNTCLREAAKDNDTDNCEDVRLFYFVSKIYWMFNYFVVQQEHKFTVQLSLYLVIFINAPFLFEKYDEQSHQIDQEVFQRIKLNLNRQILKRFDQIIDQIDKFDQEHKDIIYPYIFRTVLRQNYKRLDYYKQLIKKQPLVQQSFWSYQLASQIKQKNIQYLKEFFTCIKKRKHYKWMQQLRHKAYLFELIKFNLKNLSKFQLKNKIHSIFEAFSSKQMTDQFKRFYSLLRFLANRTASKLSQCVQISVIMTVYQDFYYQFQRNSVLEQQFIKISKAFIRNKDLNIFFQKLIDYFHGDYLSQNSHITFLDSNSKTQQYPQYLQNQQEIIQILNDSSFGIQGKVINCMKQLIIWAEDQNIHSLLMLAQQLLNQQGNINYQKILFYLKLFSVKKIKLNTFIKKISLLIPQYNKENKSKQFLQQNSKSISFGHQSNVSNKSIMDKQFFQNS